MPAEQKPSVSKQRSQSVASAIFNPQEGTFLGRNASSWARILVFYLIYYTFLGLLFWGSLELINMRIKKANNGEFPAINTRLDEPGLTVYPHNTIIGDELNEQLEFAVGKISKNPSEENKEMEAENNYIISQYDRRLLKPNMDKCKKNDPIAKSAEQMKKKLAKGFEQGKPYFALKINRVHKWTPVTVREADEDLQKHLAANKASFKENSVYFTCEEADAKYGEKDDDGNSKKNLNKVIFNNPQGWKNCGFKKAKTNNIGCIPASYYTTGKGQTPRFTGFNPFAEKTEEAADPQWGDAHVPGCWPFAYAQVVPKDSSKPVAIKCRVHLENINSEVDNPANYGWVKFGFKGKNYGK